jgi:hypothetical protein
VVKQSHSVSVPALNANCGVFKRWPQQALPAACTATAAQLVPSFAAHQACAAGPNESGLPHTLLLSACAGALLFARLFNLGAIVASVLREARVRAVPVPGSSWLRSRSAQVRSFGRGHSPRRLVCQGQMHGRQSPPKCNGPRSVGAPFTR